MLIKVKVKPNTSKTELLFHKDNEYVIAIAAPPDKNKANTELIKFFKKELGMNVKIKSGLNSRNKVLILL